MLKPFDIRGTTLEICGFEQALEFIKSDDCHIILAAPSHNNDLSIIGRTV